METCRKCHQPIKSLLGGGSSGLFGTCSSCLKNKQQEQIRAQSSSTEVPSYSKFVGPFWEITSDSVEDRAKCCGTDLVRKLYNTEETRQKLVAEIVSQLKINFEVVGSSYNSVTKTFTCRVALRLPKSPDQITLHIDGSSELGD